MTKASDRNRADAEAIGIDCLTRGIEGKPVSYRRVTCSSCPVKLEVRHAFDAPAASVRRNFEAKGWKVHKGRWTCPSCCRIRTPQAKTITTIEPKETSTMTVTTVPAPAQQLREPTPKDKQRIREYLDGHFDDDKGQYLDGHSDQSGAELLKVPRAWITDLREGAYGPIKGDPELTELRAEMVQFRLAIKAAEDAHALNQKRLAERLEALLGRIAAVEKRLAS